METQQRSCADKVQENFKDREKDFVQAKEFYDKYEDATEGEKIALEVFNEDAHLDGYEDFFDYINNYGLAFDYVEKGTFTDQERGYFRYQLSWGGPSDEFRIYVDYDKQITHIDYWFLDWGDGASVRIPEDSISYEVCEQFTELSTEIH
tara:strand:- start:125 stop:571 length:447 start_codon:yes stop_codon:yes gene_type:complete